MKFAGHSLMFLTFAVVAHAQLEMDLVTEQRQFLAGEELRIGVRIGNVSGQTLRFGEDEDWVTFTFDPNDRVRVTQSSPVPTVDPFSVTNSTRVTRWFDLAPHFEIVQPGHYTLNAVVRIKDWNEERVVRPIKLEVINASTVWEQRFGVPPGPGRPAGVPEIRKYVLLQTWVHDAQRLYLRITDEGETKIHKVVGIDRILQMNDPIMPLIDQDSRLHVLHRTGRISYNYSVFDTDGRLLIRQRHDYNELTGSRPTLRTREGGEVIIFGGVRKNTPYDVPPSERELGK